MFRNLSDQVQHSVEQMARHRKRIAKAAQAEDASDYLGFDTLDRMVSAYAATQGYLHVVSQALEAINSDTLREMSHDERMNYIKEMAFEFAIRNPGDTYSGRGNDATRSYADGIRDGARELASWARYAKDGDY